MKSRTEMWMTVVCLIAAMAMTVQLFAQENPGPKAKHHKYKVVDMGTFGGPTSYFNVTTVNGTLGLNKQGVAVGTSATSLPSDDMSNGWVCFGANGLLPFVFHPFEWKNGVVRDLALSAPGRCSNPLSINDSGDIVGSAEINRVDPIIDAREVRAVLWKNWKSKSLGTLGGSHSSAQSINEHGQVVGFAQNQTPDPFSMFYLLFGSTDGTQTRAFLWQDGTMHDLQTLGGPDSWAAYVNERGEAVGWSYISYIPNSDTGVPTQDPFLWSKARGMIDLGGFGGTFGFPTRLNDRGQVSGLSYLTGDLVYHPFFWDGKSLLDLGTFGGDTGEADSLNDRGEVVGVADFPGNQVHDAFLWKNGKMTDLGNLGKTSHAYWINAKSQIVGTSRINDAGEIRAFLWENEGPMIDLNALVPPDSPLLLATTDQINDRGEIAGRGLPLGCDDLDACSHAYVLVPAGDCDDDCGARIAASGNNPAVVTKGTATVKEATKPPAIRVSQLHDRLTGRYHTPGRFTARSE